MKSSEIPIFLGKIKRLWLAGGPQSLPRNFRRTPSARCHQCHGLHDLIPWCFCCEFIGGKHKQSEVLPTIIFWKDWLSWENLNSGNHGFSPQHIEMSCKHVPSKQSNEGGEWGLKNASVGSWLLPFNSHENWCFDHQLLGAFYCVWEFGNQIWGYVHGLHNHEKDKPTKLIGGLEHFLFFHSVGNIIIPTDFHIFQRGRDQPPTSKASSISMFFSDCIYRQGRNAVMASLEKGGQWQQVLSLAMPRPCPAMKSAAKKVWMCQEKRGCPYRSRRFWRERNKLLKRSWHGNGIGDWWEPYTVIQACRGWMQFADA